MSIYERFTVVRDEIMAEERNTVLRYEKLNVLSKVLEKAFKNSDEIPKQFNLQGIEWPIEMLKKFLEQIPEVKVGKIERKVLKKQLIAVYEITLI